MATGIPISPAVKGEHLLYIMDLPTELLGSFTLVAPTLYASKLERKGFGGTGSAAASVSQHS